MQNSILS